MSDAIDILTIEVGSTITKVNGFKRLAEGGFKHVAQGFAATSITEGDVCLGVERATADLEALYGAPLAHHETFVNSSAAGGLRMTVHGLTYSMTARAAQEAALGAGAIVKMVTAGELDAYDLKEIQSIRPNIILLAGGVDYGEKDIVLRNAEKIAALRLPVPVLYAGNVAIKKHIQQIFVEAGIEMLQAANVFPEVDVLNIEPLRKVIHEVFNRHIIHAPGMARFAELTDWGILPTPGAVLRGAELFAEEMGDCLVFDVGGATTDVHSVTDGSREWAMKMVEPEPRAKRTVEGDLGVFINAHNILELDGDPEWQARLADLQAIPSTEREKELTRWLCKKAVEIGVRRHAGVVSDLYTPTGKKQIVKGKDLTGVQWVVGTGGALTRIAGGEVILRAICTGPGKHLLPGPEAKILMDRDYRFSALGTLAQAYPEDVKATFRQWVEMEYMG
ncbi:MAG TPA: glutamate mutase L [Anaerolineaceae bacterium]|nr:glutamate mutase L [Anaerolineaceae bacterium]